MKRALLLLPLLCMAADSITPTITCTDKPLLASVRKICAQCPQSYPARVAVLPGPDGLKGKTDDELITMLEHWNPALRVTVRNELASRGVKAIPALKQLLASDDPRQRAGGAAALGNIINRQLSNWKETCPDAVDAADAKEQITSKHSDVVDAVLELLSDPELEVRRSALGAMWSLGTGRKDIATAILELCGDDDEFLAQDAMLLLEKRIGIENLEADVFVAGFKEAMKQPLPRGKGHMIRLLAKLEEEHQRQCIPVLLTHLDWYPDRDTMFAAGGQAQALQILTALDAKEVIPRLPKLLEKRLRGLDMFEDAVASAQKYGADAKPVLPKLRDKMSEIEKELEEARKSTHRHAAETVKKLEDRLARIRKAVDHVAGM